MTITNQQPVHVIGHKNPDADAICSAIGYADFLRRTGRYVNARAACCGGLTERAAWVLDQAGVDPPELIVDVRRRAESICERNVVCAKPEETFLDVYTRMVDGGFRAIPIVDDQGKVIAVPSIMELLGLLLPKGDASKQTRHVTTSIENIARALNADMINPIRVEEENDLILTVGASSVETFTQRLSGYPSKKLLVISGDRPQIQEGAIAHKVRALIITGGFRLSAELKKRAIENGVSVLLCEKDSASTAQLVRCSRRVGSLTQEKKFLGFPANMLASDILNQVATSQQVLFPVEDSKTGELVGVLSKSDLVRPQSPKLILVDHNEFSQAVRGAETSEILEVIDHHRLSGDLKSNLPVRFINEIVGSTCTMVGRFFRQEGLIPDRGIAVCLCGGIISDTLKLQSPTTTDIDHEILQWLAGVAEINIDDFAEGFFTTGSVLLGSSAKDALHSDRKEFDEGGLKISISQIEELGMNHFWPKKEELEKELENLITERGLDFACLMVTDIPIKTSMLLCRGSAELQAAIPYEAVSPGLYKLVDFVSRKKQLFPLLGSLIAELETVSN